MDCKQQWPAAALAPEVAALLQVILETTGHFGNTLGWEML